ncbi:MAG: helix-turn-helix domain-containing protein, partial [Candidatus ainarchaeum sp.]|nr:helix-turn-helix domain-containing protein [Candidatus ainarchaeum sp.]
RGDVARNLEKFNDPLILAEIAYKLTEERENTNRILKTLLEKMEALERKIEKLEGKKEAPMLPEVDEAIRAFLKEGPKSAEDVQKKFGYKGRNAASARLNRLHDCGVVVRRRVGKKVFFSLA